MEHEGKPDAESPPVAGGTAIARRTVEAETLPSYGIEGVDIDYERLLQVAEKRAKFVTGVRKLAVGQTRPQDWLGRRQKGGGMNYDLMGPGAERIRAFCSVGFQNKVRREETWTKEAGPGYTVYYEAEVYIGNPGTGALPVMGTCSSDDDFFSSETVKLPYVQDNPEHQRALDSGEGNLSEDKKTLYIHRHIPAGEVTKENIEKAALTNLIVNGVTRVLGIRKMSLDDLRGYGIDVDKISAGVDYGSTRGQSGRLAPALEQQREDIKKMLLEMNGGDESKALADMKRRTAFKAREPGGRDYPGCESWERLSEKQLPRLHEAVAPDYARFRGEQQPAGPPAAQRPPAKGGGKGQTGPPPQGGGPLFDQGQ